MLRLPPAVTRSVSPPLRAAWGWLGKGPIGCPDPPASGQELWEARAGTAKDITGPALALVGDGEGDERLAQAREYREGVPGPKWEYRGGPRSSSPFCPQESSH